MAGGGPLVDLTDTCEGRVRVTKRRLPAASARGAPRRQPRQRWGSQSAVGGHPNAVIGSGNSFFEILPGRVKSPGQISRCARLRASSRCTRLRRRAWAAGVRTPPAPLLGGSRIAFGREVRLGKLVGRALPQPSAEAGAGPVLE